MEHKWNPSSPFCGMSLTFAAMSRFDEEEAFEAAISKPKLSQMAMAARPAPYLDGLNPEQRQAVESLCYLR